MKLDLIQDALKETTRKPATMEAFKLMRNRRRSLHRFSSPKDMMEFLNSREIENSKARSAVTATLIAAAQRRDNSIALTLLTLAFFPGLLNLRRRLQPMHGLTEDDINALLLESFFQRIINFNLKKLGRRAVLNLIFGTRKIVWEVINGEQRYQKNKHLMSKLESRLVPSPELLFIVLEAEQRKEELFQRLISTESEKNILLLFQTYGQDVSLIDWLRGEQPNLEHKEFIREYARIRRLRVRVIARMKMRATLISSPDCAPAQLDLDLNLKP